MSHQVTLDSILAIEHLLSDEEKQTRDAIRGWVRDRFLPTLTEHHRAGTFPTELLPEIADLGAFGASIEGYGCAGLNNVSYGLVLQELERGDSGLRSLCSVQGSLVMYPILTFGNEEQRKKWLPELASGRMIGCFGLTEPNAGSDPASMSTTAVKDGDHYILNGVKMWITNSPISHLAVVWAKVEDEDNRIRGFVVERGTPGFDTPFIEGKFSLRASPTGEIHLTDCRVPAANMLPESGGLKSPLMCLTQAREGIAWGITGPAIDCFETVLNYGMERIAFQKPIASFQLYQAQLAEMATMITNSQLMSLHFGRLKDDGKLTPVQVSMHKRHNVDVARKIASMSRGMLGGNGITDAYPVMRHMMNIESVYTYEGTHEIHTLAVGRALTGISAFG
ncbi:MAG: acyl-CoA dehydrogenase family protein [Myxococcota bacterium]|nr:acyl-CoA dehydrogenase family protein [Myxococcota bacterium]